MLTNAPASVTDLPAKSVLVAQLRRWFAHLLFWSAPATGSVFWMSRHDATSQTVLPPTVADAFRHVLDAASLWLVLSSTLILFVVLVGFGATRLAALMAEEFCSALYAGGSFALVFALAYDAGVSNDGIDLVMPGLLFFGCGALGIFLGAAGAMILAWRSRRSIRRWLRSRVG